MKRVASEDGTIELSANDIGSNKLEKLQEFNEQLPHKKKDE